MTTAPARKKSAAYEQGLREGRADKTKKPSFEIKPEGEEESPEPDEEEEMDSSAALPKRHSRKRSAKNAHNTKAPMDGGMYGRKPMDGGMYGKKPMDGEGCGCDGAKKGRKASCDGSCGGYAKKMDRNDALTPQEYLKACELGIQGRSRTYIRARLDTAERLDLKCGKGAISEGEKCTKGTAQRAPSSEQRTAKGSRRRVAGNVLTAVGTVGNLATAYGAMKGFGTGNAVTLSKALQRQAAFSALTGAGQHLTASGTTNKRERAELRAMGNASLGVAAFGGIAGHSLGGGYTKGLGQGIKKPNFANTAANIKGRASAFKGAVVQRKRRASLERMYKKPGRRDSVYAAGFSPELDQLAI